LDDSDVEHDAMPTVVSKSKIKAGFLKIIFMLFISTS